MLLGQVLERLGDETFAAETLVALEDLGEYASGASRRFAQSASDEDWLALMTDLERADDAGTACLKHMLEWSLRHEAAESDDGCGSGQCTCKGS